MKTLLWWIEPIDRSRPGHRRSIMDWMICFGVSAIAGLGIALTAGSSMELAIGQGASLTVPAHAWQYGLASFVCIVGGWLGLWIVSLAGRAEVNLREDGVLEQRRWSANFFPYARIERCELVRAGRDAPLRLRIVMKSMPAGRARVREFGVAKRVDPLRVIDILKSAGVAVDNLPNG